MFQKQFFSYPKNTYLDGFWQSEKYFKSIESIIIEEYKPKESLNAENENWLKKIKSVNEGSPVVDLRGPNQLWPPLIGKTCVSFLKVFS